MAKLINELTATNFEATLAAATLPVVVDFWAAWCPPCVTLNITLEELAVAYHGRLVVYKVDADAAPELAAQYQVRGLPTLLFFKKGVLVERIAGAQAKPKLASLFDKLLGMAAAS